ncbi:MAG: hypothetical protein ACI8XM_001195 [Haloarculaceae archaeon]|jgi:hypothetical protein
MRIAKDAEQSFENHTFPSTTAEVVEEHGDVEMELPNGEVTLGNVLETVPDEDFETEEDARLAAYGALGEEAIGRKGYSDRDPACIGEIREDRISL